jgi:peptidyl-prolyl cis-trans isomerase C
MSGCSSHSHSHDHDHSHVSDSDALPTITVNGVAISEETLANELQYHQNPQFAMVVQQAGQALVIQQLLVQEANKQGLAVADDEEKSVQKLLEQQVKFDDPEEADCERYFENNRAKFTTTPLMEVDHILLAAAKDDIPGREVAKKNALQIIAQLQKDPMLFPALASQYSACPSKETGGSLGQISKGQTVPEFERQLMLMPPGLADKPVESRYGFHVVNIARKIDGKPLEYSMVADKVRGYLVHRASHLAIQAYIQSLVEVANIEGIELRFAEENVHI